MLISSTIQVTVVIEGLLHNQYRRVSVSQIVNSPQITDGLLQDNPYVFSVI